MNSEKAKVPAATPEEDYVDRWLKLDNDLLTEIFIRLPAKSVTRCKLVCKHWNSFVSSDEFCHLHTQRYPKPQPSFILDLGPSRTRFINFDPIMNGKKQIIPYTFSVPTPIIMNSCNGLMLVKSHYTDESFHVYNPTTKLSRKMSVTVTHSGKNPSTVGLGLAFDPSKSPHYKVVCIRSTTERLNDDYAYQIEVYDSASCKWELKLGPFEFVKLQMCGGCEGVYFNGSIYWETIFEIVYYDIARNRFESLPLPDYPHYESEIVELATTSCLQEANGCLYISRLVPKANNKSQAIELFELEMNDDRSSSWLLRYEETIHQHEFPIPFPGRTYLLRFIKGSNATETCSVVSHMCGKISVYSFLDKSFKLLFDVTGPPLHMQVDYLGPPRHMHVNYAGPELELYEFVVCLAVV
ncbi:F-box protein-like protein isoform X1 [Salvia divinorum]|uniref:F-box protein-like protein isoform X1 n=1 Tax=Salvia divinorum TaxID=28513 RepID=A0ABD1GW81_SALDI